MSGLAWAGAALLWTCALGAGALIWRHLHSVMRHRYEGALTQWARWTTLTVTDRDGTISVMSLSLLFDRHRSGRQIDQAWAGPLSVALWTAERPDLYRAWHKEDTLAPDPRDTDGG